MSLLALKIKRDILMELKDGCPSHRDKPEKQKEILAKYGPYADAYTAKELEWYGLSVPEARKKLQAQMEAANQPVPLKHEYRRQLIQQLKDAALAEAEVVISEDGKNIFDRKTGYVSHTNFYQSLFMQMNIKRLLLFFFYLLYDRGSWLSKINPFSKS